VSFFFCIMFLTTVPFSFSLPRALPRRCYVNFLNPIGFFFGPSYIFPREPCAPYPDDSSPLFVVLIECFASTHSRVPPSAGRVPPFIQRWLYHCFSCLHSLSAVTVVISRVRDLHGLTSGPLSRHVLPALGSGSAASATPVVCSHSYVCLTLSSAGSLCFHDFMIMRFTALSPPKKSCSPLDVSCL